eukprot:gene7050-7632_t
MRIPGIGMQTYTSFTQLANAKGDQWSQLARLIPPMLIDLVPPLLAVVTRRRQREADIAEGVRLLIEIRSLLN